MLSARLPLSTLIELCRTLRHYLGAGLTLHDVFRQQAQRGPAAVRPVAGRVAAVIEDGGSLESALKREAAVFPPLFLALAGVGEHTGMLPEVFAELERYFQRQLALRQQFWARAAWPLVQFFLAVFVLAGLILVMGLLPSAPGPGGQRFDPLGLGLFGVGGALTFLGVIFGTLLTLGVLFVVVRRGARGRAAVDRFLLGVPAIGPCLRALALGRFCLALRLTTETGMSIAKALRLSLRATGNAAFAALSPGVEASVRAGDELALALRGGLFPDEFHRFLTVAEESGTLGEVMRHQGEQYHEEASRRLAALTSVAGYGVWAFVGVCIIVAIFRIYGSYLKLLDSI